MAWKNNYNAPTNQPWQGRPDLPTNACFFQVMQLLNLNDTPPKHTQPAFAFLGFCCDAGIKRNFGRTGAAEGPAAIREVLAKMPAPRTDVLYYDAGDIICHDDNLEDAQDALAEAIKTLLKHHYIPIVLGGGHELAWGHYQGIAHQYARENLGIINFDSHFDMRPLSPERNGTSGTPFLQIAEAHESAGRRLDYNCIGIQQASNIELLFETAHDFNVQVIMADDIHHGKMKTRAEFVQRIINQNNKLYVSICLDVFAAPFAPGVSAPQPMGIFPWSIMPLIKQLAKSGNVVSYDIAELSPKYDVDNITAKLAATCVYEIVLNHQC